MKIFFEPKEMDEYENVMTKIACLIYLESKKALLEMNRVHVTLDDIRAIEQAAGQVIYDDIIQVTKDMSREDLVKYFAQSAIAWQVKTMNDNPEYRHSIIRLTERLGEDMP